VPCSSASYVGTASFGTTGSLVQIIVRFQLHGVFPCFSTARGVGAGAALTYYTQDQEGHQCWFQRLQATHSRAPSVTAFVERAGGPQPLACSIQNQQHSSQFTGSDALASDMLQTCTTRSTLHVAFSGFSSSIPAQLCMPERGARRGVVGCCRCCLQDKEERTWKVASANAWTRETRAVSQIQSSPPTISAARPQPALVAPGHHRAASCLLQTTYPALRDANNTKRGRLPFTNRRARHVVGQKYPAKGLSAPASTARPCLRWHLGDPPDWSWLTQEAGCQEHASVVGVQERSNSPCQPVGKAAVKELSSRAAALESSWGRMVLV
jgi:hypothetical protein